MLKSDRICLIYRILCFICFCIPILFDNSFITLILIGISFYLLNRDFNSFPAVLLNVFTIMIFFYGYNTGNIFVIRFMLMVDFFYYFFHDAIIDGGYNLIKKKKKSYTYRKLKKAYTNKISQNIVNEYEDEFSKGNNLNAEEKEKIKNNLTLKTDEVVSDKLESNYIRFYKNRNDLVGEGNSGSLAWKVDSINVLFVTCHIIILAFVILVG